MSEVGHTQLPWKVVSDPHFDSGLVYTSIQPVDVDEEAMKPLAMANGEHHVCRMSHTAAPWRFSYHRANAEFIVRACNAHYELLAGIKRLSDVYDGIWAKMSDGEMEIVREAWAAVEASVAKAEGRSNV